MKLHFLKEDALAAMKGNLDANLHFYRSPDNAWIYDYFQGENPFGEFKLEVPDFQLTFDCQSGDYAKSDIQNAKILYSALINLSDTQATDERLWAGMCHCDFWDYCHERWNHNDNTENQKQTVINRYFFKKGDGMRRALQQNTLSKLWWVARYVYDASRKDPFELLDYFQNDFATKTLVILSNNYISCTSVAHGLISALLELEAEGFTINRSSGGRSNAKQEVFYEATRYLNIFGGTHILDYYSSEEIKEKVIQHLKNQEGIVYRTMDTTPSHSEPKVESVVTDETDRVEASATVENSPYPAETDPPVSIPDDEPIAVEIPEIEVDPSAFGFAGFAGDDSFFFSGEQDNSLRKEAEFIQDDVVSEEPTPQEVIRTVPAAPADEGYLQYEFPETDLIAALRDHAFVCLDNRSTSGLIWVIYDSSRAVDFKMICERFNAKYKFERRGAKATDNKAAWCILQQK